MQHRRHPLAAGYNMGETPRILFVVASHRWTGAAQPTVYLAQALARSGAEVSIACGPGALADEARARGVRCETVLPARGSSGAARRGLVPLSRLLRAVDPDVVHAVLTAAHWLVGAVGRAGRRERVLVAHNFRQFPLRRDPLHGWLYARRFAGIVEPALSLLEQDCAGLGLGRDRMLHLPGAVDAARFDRPAAGLRLRAASGAGPEAVLIGVVARMQRKRRHELVLTALARARERLPPFRLVLVGKGEYLPALERQIEALGLGPQTVWTVRLDLPFEDCVAGLDLSVYPREGSDGTARTVLECMAAGVPVIAAPRPVLRELIEDGRNGRLVDPQDEPRLAEAIVALARSPADRARLAEAGRRTVADRTWPAMARRTLAFYDRLLSLEARESPPRFG